MAVFDRAVLGQGHFVEQQFSNTSNCDSWLLCLPGVREAGIRPLTCSRWCLIWARVAWSPQLEQRHRITSLSIGNAVSILISKESCQRGLVLLLHDGFQFWQLLDKVLESWYVSSKQPCQAFLKSVPLIEPCQELLSFANGEGSAQVCQVSPQFVSSNQSCSPPK